MSPALCGCFAKMPNPWIPDFPKVKKTATHKSQNQANTLYLYLYICSHCLLLVPYT